MNPLLQNLSPLSVPLPPLALFDFVGSFATEVLPLLIPIIAIICTFAMIIFVQYFKHRDKALWHETARIALEKGQPMPPMPGGDDDDAPPQGMDTTTWLEYQRKRQAHGLLVGGLVCVGVGVGLYLFLGSLASGLGYIGAIPGFLGVGLVVAGLVSGLFSSSRTGR